VILQHTLSRLHLAVNPAKSRQKKNLQCQFTIPRGSFDFNQQVPGPTSLAAFAEFRSTVFYPLATIKPVALTIHSLHEPSALLDRHLPSPRDEQSILTRRRLCNGLTNIGPTQPTPSFSLFFFFFSSSSFAPGFTADYAVDAQATPPRDTSIRCWPLIPYL
jgi:hypothetical protein